MRSSDESPDKPPRSLTNQNRLILPPVPHPATGRDSARIPCGAGRGSRDERSPIRAQLHSSAIPLSAKQQRRAAWSVERLARLRLGVDAAVDRFRFRIDTFPWTYQPASGSTTARRSEGTLSRWREMERVVHDLRIETAIDVGCNGGWFVLRLAECGVVTVGVEEDRRFCRMLSYESNRRGLSNVGVMAIHVDSDTVRVLPQTDAVLFLSVWHHVVKASGLDAASDILRRLWDKVDKVLFFETGQAEIPPDFGLPTMGPDPAEWLASYLANTCPGSEVQHLGEHEGFAPSGEQCFRSLFAVHRIAATNTA